METVFLTRNQNANKIILMMAHKIPDGTYINAGFMYCENKFNTVSEADDYCLKHNLKIVY